MQPTPRAAAFTVAALLTAAIFVPAPATASDQRLIRRCTAEGTTDISLQVRYEERGNRKKFRVEFEAAPRIGYHDGQLMTYVVAGVNVASDRLQTIVGGDLVSEVEFDTRIQAGDDARPFPPNFPNVVRHTKVQVKTGGTQVLACMLN